jgi:hypothetical protein
MTPKHRQPNAPRPKPAGNAYTALVDLPHDGSDPSTDGRDGRDDGSDGKSDINAPVRVYTAGTPAAAPPSHTPNGDPPLRVWRHKLIEAAVGTFVYGDPIDYGPGNHFQYSAASLCAVEQAHIETQRHLHSFEERINSNFDKLLQKMDAAWVENTALREAYRTSREETAALKAAVHSLRQKIDEQLTIPAPPSPDLLASPTTVEEMMMQLSVVQHDIQDVLEAVRNPPGKRKRRTSNQDAEPTTLTNRRPATNKQCDASPEHSLMHSQHATSAAQDALDALMRKYPPCPLAITSTEATTDPLPNSTAVQDTTLPDAPTTTAPAEKDGWKTMEGKEARKKRRNEKVDNKPAATTASNTPKTKTGGRGKNTHQPKPTTPSAKKTWSEVVKSGGINV